MSRIISCYVDTIVLIKCERYIYYLRKFKKWLLYEYNNYSSCIYNMYYTFMYQVNREDQESDVGVSSAVAEGSSASSGDVDDSFDGKETDKESKKKKNRCAVCRKKVGLTGKRRYGNMHMIETQYWWRLGIFLSMMNAFRFRVPLWRTVLRRASVQR